MGGFGTLIGAGGGFILVPVLLLLYPDKSPETITSISLAVVFLNALSGSISYARMKLIDYKSGLMLASTVVPASIIGAVTTAYIPRRLFDIFFALLLILIALYISIRPQKASGSKGARKSYSIIRKITDVKGVVYNYSFNPAIGLTTGACVGFLSSLMGIGGGIIHVPILIHLLTFPVHLATATSLFMLAIMSFSATLVHFSNGLIAEGLSQIVAIGIGVIMGAPVGARISQHIKGRWIVRSLALALGLVGIRILLTAF